MQDHIRHHLLSFNVYTEVTTSHRYNWLVRAVIPQPGQLYHLGSYTMAGKLYHGRVQGISVHMVWVFGPGCFAVLVGGLSNPIEP